MAIILTCSCGRSITVPDTMAGKRGKCPQCGNILSIPSATTDEGAFEISETGKLTVRPPAVQPAPQPIAPVVSQTPIPTPVYSPPLPLAPPAPTAKTKKQYKVLTQKDKWFSGKFDPEKLEQAMNAYADQGWEVKAAVTASIPGLGGSREELVIILER